jgi:hypothetical protein
MGATNYYSASPKTNTEILIFLALSVTWTSQSAAMKRISRKVFRDAEPG